MGIICRKEYIANWKYIKRAYLPATTLCQQNFGLIKIKTKNNEWISSNKWKFDSSRVGSGILSNNFRTVTGNDTSYNSVYGTFPMKKGKKYIFSVNFETANGTDNSCVGIANYNHNYLMDYAGGDGQPGSEGSTNSMALWDSGLFYYQNNSYEIFENFTSGVVDVAVDRINNLIWFRINRGLWNNETSSPIISSGFDISEIKGTVYPVVFAFSSIPTVISVNTISSIS